ncbi:Clp protease ClpP [Cytobacillus firmus]|nr:Clp protease ClpP [Cytobacillus firmus]MBG9655074.1 Clp protease ClpP [Cytobacillus firmus]
MLHLISHLRNRDVLVFAADYTKGNAPISISFEDLLPINDQFSNLNGNRGLDLILETPGGSGEVAEDIVRLLRSKYNDIAVIIPGWAKSAGTIMAMACDEILMEPSSALGPIDAQISRNGQVFSADALIKGMEEIKEEVNRTNTLNVAYVPILQNISPGELQGAQNALDFAKDLVQKWLVDYKFKDWNNHSDTGEPVSLEEKQKRAYEIASTLADHGKWLTHGRSIKIQDLEDMKLKIVDYSKDEELADAIRRYYTLLKLTFESNVYKVYETVDSQIFKSINNGGISQPDAQPIPKSIPVQIECGNCSNPMDVQANLGEEQPLEEGYLPFPPNNILKCTKCPIELDITQIRKQIESQTGLPVV